tara:strand:- start:392 stop:892 length:501 start_codon:yes stop_codon:yes gene_type:complete
MTITLDGTTGITTPALDSVAPFSSADMPSLSILQIQEMFSTTTTNTTSTTFQPTAFNVTITPSSASSKILVFHQGMFNAQSTANWAWVSLYRDGTNLVDGGQANAAAGVYANGSTDTHVPVTFMYLDSPNTTSSVNYKIYVKSGNGNPVRYNADGWKLRMYAMELK